MSSIYDWSTTAASNANIDSAIVAAEGQTPGSVNNDQRAVMGRLAEFVKDIGGTLTAGGTANGLTVTANAAFTTYAQGRIVAFKAASDNTGAATLNVNSIGAKAIRYMSSAGDTALAAGMIQAGGIYVVRYDTAVNSAAGGWLLAEPTLDGVFANRVSPSVDNTAVRFNGTDGSLQTSGVTISDADGLGAATLTATGQVTGASFVATTTNAILAPSAAGNILLRVQGAGSSSNQVSIASTGAITATGGGSLTGTWSDHGTVTTMDLNGGTIDGTAIGSSSASTGAFTTLSASGATTLAAVSASGQITASDGTAGAPGMAFTNDPDCGFYRIGTNSFGLSLNSQLRVTYSTGSITTTLPAWGPDGSASAPSWTFSGDTNTGVYRIGTDNLGFTTGGTLRFDISTTAITSTLPINSALNGTLGATTPAAASVTTLTASGVILGPAGSASAPTFAPSTDTNTGVYSVGADSLGVTAGGTLRVTFNTGNVTSTVPFLGANGSAAAPTFGFSGDSGNGVFLAGADNVGISTGGTQRVDVSTTAVTSTLPIAMATGSTMNSAPIASVYTGTSGTNTDFPIGTELIVLDTINAIDARNGTAAFYFGAGGTSGTTYSTTGLGSQITGTWRGRGDFLGNSGDRYVKVQKTA